jgi:hypothetical protein
VGLIPVIKLKIFSRDSARGGFLLMKSVGRFFGEQYEDNGESWIDDSLGGRFHGKQPSGNRWRATRFLESPWTCGTRGLVCEEHNRETGDDWPE